jgi:hypothetical protein
MRPDADELGTTRWTITIDRPEIQRAGRGGHVALARGTALDVIGPEGTRAWATSLAGEPIDLVVDEAGGVVVLHRSAPGAIASTLSRFTDDGTLRWSAPRPDDPSVASTMVVLDVDDATWVLSTGFLVDTRWERYDAAGIRIGGDVLSFKRPGSGVQIGAALPAGGIAFPDEQGGISAIDNTGMLLWRIAPGFGFAVHDDGEITLLRGAFIERLDAARQPRWSRSTNFNWALVALDDGGVIVAGSDGLGDTSNLPTLHHLDRDGAMRREVVRADFDAFTPVPGPPAHGYRILAARVRFDDRHYEVIARDL